MDMSCLRVSEIIMRRGISLDVLITSWSPDQNEKKERTPISLSPGERKGRDFKKWLSRYMERMKMTPPDITQEIGTNRSAVYLWLSGRRIARDPIHRSRLALLISERMDLSYRDVLRDLLWRCHISECRRLL